MKRRSEAGFTLIELMIAGTLGLMVLAGIATGFSQASRARTELERMSQQVDNGRYAIEVLSEDLQLAGFYGEMSVVGLPVPGAVPDPCSTAQADWVAAIPLHVQGYDEGVAVPSCVPASLVAATDVVAVRRVRTCVAGSTGCDAAVAAEPYLQVGLCTSGAPYVLGLQGTATFSLTAKDCATVAGQRRYVVNIYFVSTDNGAGVRVPTLKRMEFTGAGFTEAPLVEGIERLHFEYGLDLDGDGSPDAYTANPTSFTQDGCTTCTAPNNWANVVTAKVHVLARTLEPSAGYVDTKTYAMGIDAAGAQITVGPFRDGYKRRVYSSAVRVMNPSARRDRS